jgi:hypothetical protein
MRALQHDMLRRENITLAYQLSGCRPAGAKKHEHSGRSDYTRYMVFSQPSILL